MPCRRLGTSGRGLRIMTSKRALVAILASVCTILGVYLGFFNHPPAAETLEINLHRGLGDDTNAGKVIPHFRHLHFGAGDSSPAKSSAVRALNISDSDPLSTQTFKKVDQFRTANNLTKITTKSTTNETPLNLGASRSLTSSETKEQERQLQGEQVHENQEEQPQEQQGDISQNQDAGEQKENNSGWNAGEEKPDFEEQDVPLKDGEDVQDIDDKNVGRSKEYGPHHIRIFDWDGWVKQHNYIDIGTIWAYCDDPEPPPPVGKVMMKKDEEYGSGVKIVIHMNSTFEENIEFGKIGLSVDVNGVHFFSKKYDACAMVSQSEFFRCPIQAGDKYFYIEQHVPAFLPTGEYYVESQLIDQFDRTIVCAQVKMTL